MPKNANILLVRHAEKPDQGVDLAPAGQARAQAYIAYFQNYLINAQPIKLSYLFAAKDSHESHRPRLTLEPLSLALNLSIDAKHADACYQDVKDDIFNNAKYDESNILICWHHGEILQLAHALVGDRSQLPPQANWPVKWPGDVFGWLLQVSYDANGNLIPKQTFCINQRLMYDDYGKEPLANLSQPTESLAQLTWDVMTAAMIADRTGPISALRETIAAGRFFTIAQEKYADNQLIQQVIKRLSQHSEKQSDAIDMSHREEAYAALMDKITDATARLSDDEDMHAFKQFLVELAEMVAQASGGGLFASGQKVTSDERSFLDRLKAMLNAT